MPNQCVFRSQRVILPAENRAADVVVTDGIITRVCDHGSATADAIFDFDDRWLCPGLIDTHVHINQPGRTEWEGFETATRAAKAGGITVLVDMPLNSSPVTVDEASLQAKRDASVGQLHVDVGAHAGLIPTSAATIDRVIAAGALAAKAFLCPSGIDEFPHVEREDLRLGMTHLASINKPLLAHAEISQPAPVMEHPTRYEDYLRSRGENWEAAAIECLIDLSRETGCHVHIVHLSAASCLPMLRQARADGVRLSVETCPHYLCLDAESIPDGATEFKCAPPIRHRDNQAKLWDALIDGDIDMIVSDHSPCPLEMKALDSGRFDIAWGGIASLQIGLPLIWTNAQRRGVSLRRVIDWMSTQPANLVGIPAGIAAGNPAHLFVFDDQARWRINKDRLHHRHSITPYDEYEVVGRVDATFVHGFDDNQHRGRFLS